MLKPIIEIKNIGKQYQIGGQRERYLSLRDEIVKRLSFFARRAKEAKNVFWALKDVNFSVQPGETVGIIGRNGAGKSTLLKILSQITPPTEGRITCRGRVASLLEVGTGFHPELTGMENIFLNGTILGMTRAEVRKKMEEIIAFSEIEKFLNTPVKRYSSGMYVRLAFAVAAHLEPEILVVDEVLAVGDAQFQRKCLGKMAEVARGGRTVIFVSHNMGAVSQLCDRGVVLVHGGVSFVGPVDDALRAYAESTFSGTGTVQIGNENKSNDIAMLKYIRIKNDVGDITSTFFIGDTMRLQIGCNFSKVVRTVQISFNIRATSGANIYHCVTKDAEFELSNLEGEVIINAVFSNLALYPGSYVIDELWLATGDNQTLDYARDVMQFQVAEGGRCVFRPLALHAAVVHVIPEWTICSKPLVPE